MKHLVDVSLLILLAIIPLGIVALGLRATFYRWWLTSLLQLDARYQNDASWRNAADSALFRFDEATFAKQQGVITEIPRWFARARYAIVCAVAVEIGLFALGRYL